jgi:hypothetical protein
MPQIYADDMQVSVFICEHLRNLWLRIFLLSRRTEQEHLQEDIRETRASTALRPA